MLRVAAESTVYLDHHATTPVDPRVVEAMLPCFTEDFGNASSRQHGFGRAAAERVDRARTQVADLIGADPREIVFTSGATEADNLGVKGVVATAARTRDRLHVLTVATEHKAVLDCCARLEAEGSGHARVDVGYLGVDADGRVDPERLEAALRPETVLVSVMLANNEIGVVQPVAEIAAVCRRHGVLVHTDAAQALAHIDCRVDRLGVDLMSLSAHKAHGPKGVGALYARRRRPRVRLTAQMDGGGHEHGRRSGTLDVPGIVGFGAACALIDAERSSDAARLASLRDRLLAGLRDAFPDLIVNGSLAHRLPGNLNISIPGLDSERLLARLESVALSSGAACSDPGAGGSYVVKALAAAEGLDADAAARRADGSLRFGLGRATTATEIDTAIAALRIAIRRQLREPARANVECGVPA